MEIISGGEFGERDHPEEAKASVMMEPQKVRCDYKFCRGASGECPFSLVNGELLGSSIEEVVKSSTLSKAAQGQNSRKLAHQRLRIALAACPNACTEPQIKDIGIIASVTPDNIGIDCDGCRQCENVCREQAIAVHASRAQLIPEKCVGCGQCVKKCPRGAIETKGVRFRILAGGRMGRHPKWAEEMCVVDGSFVAGMIECFLERIALSTKPCISIADAVEDITTNGWRNLIKNEVRYD